MIKHYLESLHREFYGNIPDPFPLHLSKKRGKWLATQDYSIIRHAFAFLTKFVHELLCQVIQPQLVQYFQKFIEFLRNFLLRWLGAYVALHGRHYSADFTIVWVAPFGYGIPHSLGRDEVSTRHSFTKSDWFYMAWNDFIQFWCHLLQNIAFLRPCWHSGQCLGKSGIPCGENHNTENKLLASTSMETTYLSRWVMSTRARQCQKGVLV